MSVRVVVFSIIPFASIFQRPQQIPSALAKMGYQIAYITSASNSNCLVEKERYVNGGYVYEVHPCAAAYSNATRYGYSNSIDIANSIIELDNKLSQATEIPASYIFLVQVPYWQPIVKHLSNLLSPKYQIYDVMDDFTGFSDINTPQTQLEKLHKTLLSESIIIYTARSMLSSILEGASSPTYVPNAVDIELWDVERHICPGIGYFGVLAEWTDIDLLSQLGRHFRVEIIAPPPTPNIRPPANIVYLGRQDGKELVGFASRWSCGLIPFKRLPITECTNPVKLYEYMAIGLPIVATATEELKNIVSEIEEDARPLLIDTNDHQAWIYAISHAIATDSPEKTEKRKQWARKNSWTDRVRQIERIL